MQWGAAAVIDRQALQHNCRRVRELVGSVSVAAVIKADAYGHGAAIAVQAMFDYVDAFAVATVAEGVALRETGYQGSIWVLMGFADPDEQRVCLERRLYTVINQRRQLCELGVAGSAQLGIIPEIDTGMGRLGLNSRSDELQELASNAQVEVIAVMSHLAGADEGNRIQVQRQYHDFISASAVFKAPRSLANSAATLDWPLTHLDWVRPGIMLYGAVPHPGRTGAEFNLRPAMQFLGRLQGIRRMRRGDTVGYGSEWTCPEDMPVGLVRCGYADGYPRKVGAGAFVWLAGKGCPLIGRISMDSLCVDLRGAGQVESGAEVELWGPNIPVEQVAAWAGTIPHDLLCGIGPRVQRLVI